jgi:hypothetical protein
MTSAAAAAAAGSRQQAPNFPASFDSSLQCRLPSSIHPGSRRAGAPFRRTNPSGARVLSLASRPASLARVLSDGGALTLVVPSSVSTSAPTTPPGWTRSGLPGPRRVAPFGAPEPLDFMNRGFRYREPGPWRWWKVPGVSGVGGRDRPTGWLNRRTIRLHSGRAVRNRSKPTTDYLTAVVKEENREEQTHDG